MSLLKDLQKASRNESFFIDEEEDASAGRIDPDDIDDFDFPLPTETSTQVVPAGFALGLAPPGFVPQQIVRPIPGTQGPRQLDPTQYKRWVCLYPCYIDADKTIEEGRKIAKALAVRNPHGFRMAHAVQSLGMSVVFEGHKTHPRDWANPGRVRVEIKRGNIYVNSSIKTRRQLLLRVAQILPDLEKTLEIPKQLISPLTPLADIQAIADEMRRVQLGGPAVPSLPQQQQIALGPSSPSASSSLGGSTSTEPSSSKKKVKKARK